MGPDATWAFADQGHSVRPDGASGTRRIVNSAAHSALGGLGTEPLRVELLAVPGDHRAVPALRSTKLVAPGARQQHRCESENDHVERPAIDRRAIEGVRRDQAA
jgi:hypothetical protein